MEGSNTFKILYITYTDMVTAKSGSAVRPQKIYQAFLDKKYDVKILKGIASKKNKKTRLDNIKEINEWLDYNRPQICYIESPSDPIVFKEDRKLIKKIHKMGIKIGYFYRDAYYKVGRECVCKSKNILSKEYLRYIYYKYLFWRDEQLLKKNVDIIYFPSETMTKYFKFRDMRILPPAGEIIEYQRTEPKALIYVGGLSERYGTDYLLEAMEIINQKQNIDLNLICREKEMNNINPKYLESKWLKIHHASGKEQLKPFYEQSKIALFPLKPTVYNNFAISVKLFEYMSYGLPIVAIDTFETKKLIQKYNIGLVTRESANEFAKAILELYNNEELYNEVAKNVKQALESENLWTNRIKKIVSDLTNL